MAFYLALKEVWRNRGRFLLFSLVIALITTLVLFIAALAGGLATANRQFFDQLDADLLIYQENVDLQAASSRLGLSKLREVRRVDGVAAVGPIGFSAATIVFADRRDTIDVSLIGVEPGQPGDPALLAGPGLRDKRGNEVILDQALATKAGIELGEVITIKTIRGTEEEYYDLKVVGLTTERQYLFQPAIIVAMDTWDKVRPQAAGAGGGEVIANVFAVQLAAPQTIDQFASRLTSSVAGVQTADKKAAILAIPGYTAQQSTLNTQQGFTLLIGVLVVGGFFQIQTLQKVPQIGMLKAIGSSNGVVGGAALLQIVVVTVIGVIIGGLGTLLLALGLPAGIPILFSGPAVAGAITALILIGPVGGLVSIRLAQKIEPLTAIGLNS
jgi:putative ABC transport system permease protein